MAGMEKPPSPSPPNTMSRRIAVLTTYPRWNFLFCAGDDELLEADHPRHGVLQHGELPGRRPAARQLHEGVLGGKKSFPSFPK